MSAIPNVMYVASVAVVLLYKWYTVRNISELDFFSLYGLTVTAYILSRFALAESYKYEKPSAEYFPTVSVAIPAYNEEKYITKTILHHVKSDYPKQLMEILVVNDGSKDNTAQEVRKVIAEHPEVSIRLVDLPQNQGKRRALAAGVRSATNEIVVMNDSDSFVHPDAVRRIVQPFQDERVAGVTGHADVYNWKQNLLTRVQYVRYFVAFRVYKAAESLYNSVICLSGCLAAYRRSVLAQFLDQWENQKFWGKSCTYGDDRSLTTFILRGGFKAIYDPGSKTETVVPDTFRKFWKQQLRWKKSWLRETYFVSKFIWKRNPMISLSFYSNAFLTIFSFAIVLRAFFILPAIESTLPVIYLLGLAVVSFVYLAYCNKNGIYQGWIFPLVWSVLYALVMVWQIPLAILTLRDGRWGTR